MDFTQTDGLTIWVAVQRMHVPYHLVPVPGMGTTACGRSTASGVFVTTPELIEMWARPCERCWPTDQAAVTPAPGQ